MDLTSLITALPVVLTLVTSQVVKAGDQTNSFKKFYFLISLVIGLVLGGFFSSGLATLDIAKIAQDAVQNAIISSFVFVFKHNLGIRLPGDTGFVQGKFFGYTE